MKNVILKKELLIVGWLAVAWALPLFGEGEKDAEDVTRWLVQVRSADRAVRREAIGALQTSLDPRIPDACLAALRMEGDSIRRLAARAIGSRWHQISKDRTPAFLAALKPYFEGPDEGLVNMALRARALLTRDYLSPMVSVSRNRRWVIYERRGLPCLIDTRTETEELLGWPISDDADMVFGFAPKLLNRAVRPEAVWHPKDEAVALRILLNRRESTLWLWRHRGGFRPLTRRELLAAIGHHEAEIRFLAGFHAGEPEWNRRGLEFDLEFTLDRGSEAPTFVARMRWDPGTDQVTQRNRTAVP
ncbi:MAG: hypothetical protein ACKV19_04640 [Verrucomicrobiales bacterium]